MENSLTVQEVRAQVNLIQEVMRNVMKKDVHYGVIPGCQKPTLYKAGAEKILTTFRVNISPEIEDLSTEDVIRYRVRVIGSHVVTGVLGSAYGSCSSNEEKYKWRAAICEKEFENTPDDRRRIKYKKKGWNAQRRVYENDIIEIKQVRTEIADIENTVLKMAVKRAMVAFTLQATAASDVFDQDIEDIPEELRQPSHENNPPNGKPAVSSPQSKKGKVTNKNAEIRSKFIEAKSVLGVDNFSKILDNYGYKTYEQITDLKKAEVVLESMSTAMNASNGSGVGDSIDSSNDAI